jgi:hypothetical protein
LVLISHKPDFTNVIAGLPGASLKRSKAGLARLDIDPETEQGKTAPTFPAEDREEISVTRTERTSLAPPADLKQEGRISSQSIRLELLGRRIGVRSAKDVRVAEGRWTILLGRRLRR